jgi:WhiB family redox-sensing transcriptional regulator
MTPDWRDDAAYAGTDTELFYGEPGQDNHYRQVIAVYCNRCPVRRQCLADAYATDQQDGVAGGMTAHARILARAAARRRARRAA